MEKQIQKQIVKYSNELAYLKENMSRDFDKLKNYELEDYENQIKLTARIINDLKNIQVEYLNETSKEVKHFPNGFEDWSETHFEVVNLITMAISEDNPFILKEYENGGVGRMYELANDWTDEFEKQNEGKEWDGDWFEAIEDFMLNKLK